VFLLAIRVLAGWGFITAGWGKLTNVEDTAKYFAGLNIPLPTLNVYFAGTAETVGGALLILGAASRISTIPLIGTMIVAYATAHKEIFGDLFADPNAFVKEFLGPAAPPTPYLIIALVVLLFGPGLFSVDGLLKRLVFDRPCPHEPRREG
jgi:putative oxidoreductase